MGPFTTPGHARAAHLLTTSGPDSTRRTGAPGRSVCGGRGRMWSRTLADKAGLSRDSILQIIQLLLPAPVIQGAPRRGLRGRFGRTRMLVPDPERGRACMSAPRPAAPGYAERMLRNQFGVAGGFFGHLQDARAMGHAGDDWGTLMLPLQAAAGLPRPSDS